MTPPDGLPPSPGPTLWECAERRFGKLSPTEKQLFQATEETTDASMLPAKEKQDDPTDLVEWRSDRLVRAECIAWICTDTQAKTLVPHRGVNLQGMSIEGDLDLSDVKIEFPLNAHRCVFSGRILLVEAEVRGLYFSTCHFLCPACSGEGYKSLDAEGAKISGCLCLYHGCKVEGEVSLLGAMIGADLDCEGSHFINRNADALSADGIQTGGDVLLDQCEVEGTVRFIGAEIEGNFECSGARFFHEGADAFNGDAMKVGGDVLLDEGFCGEGLVSLSGSTIGGSLDCSRGRFSQAGGSLRVEGAKIEGDVLFKDNFQAKGEVILRRTAIGGDLDCENAKFLNAGDDALTADACKVGGDITFGKGFRANGEVRLFGAVVGGDIDCAGARFNNPQGALGADGAKIEGNVKFRDGVDVDGPIRFPGATIGGDLDFEDTKIETKATGEPPEYTHNALNAEGATIKGTVFFTDRVTIQGEVSLIGATIGGDLDFRRGEFRASGGAIRGDRAKIGGDVSFGDGFDAEGGVGFLGARIGGDLECDGAKFRNGKDDALSAESATIEGSIRLHQDLEVEGCLNFNNAEVHHQLDLRGFSVPEKTTLNLRLAIVGAVYADEANWKSTGHWLLDGFTYNRFQTDHAVTEENWIKWIHQQPREHFLPQPYEHLATVLRRMGSEREARQVMIAKNRDRARLTPFLSPGWWWYNAFGKLIGYGYEPWRAFAISLAMIVFGALLFCLGDSHNLISATKEGTISQTSLAKSESRAPFDPIVYSLESFTPLLKLGQSANWSPNSNHEALKIGRYTLPFTGGFLRYYLYFHIIFGWLLTSLWVGAVTGLVKS